MTGINRPQAPLFGDYSNIPEKFQAAVRAGISFFEIRSIKPLQWAQQVNGPFSVSVGEQLNPGSQRMDYSITWQTGDYARVRFEIVDEKNGLAKAFMADDPFWHNRVMIANNRDLQLISAYHTKNGLFPGTQLLEEVWILNNYLTVDAEEYSIVNAQGRALSSCRTKEEALQEIKALNYKNHEVVPVKIRVNSPAVDEMIRKWKTEHRSRFGWMDCPEFKEIKKKVIVEIESRFTSQQTQQAPLNLTKEQFDAAVIEAVRRLPVETRKKLLKTETIKQSNEVLLKGKRPARLTMPELRKEAKRLGVSFGPKTDRLALIALLRKKGDQIINDKIEQDKQEELKQSIEPQPEEEEVVT